MLKMIALAAVCGGALCAQNITGAWQGELKAGAQDVRIVIKISLDDDRLKAVMYNVDRPSAGIPASAITRDGSNIKMTIAAVGGSYEARLSADGNSLTGAWGSPGGPSLPLKLERATPETAWTIPDPPAAVPPMAANANPAFEVATIKPGNPAVQGKLMGIRGRQFYTINSTLSDLIVFAYGIHVRQIAGAPAWIESDKYDLVGDPDTPGAPSLDQAKLMLQKLLPERFQLAFHREKKELAVYALTVGKNGHKLTRSAANPAALPRLLFTKLGTLPAANASMADFASVMQAAVLDKPVVDQTGLSGKWDFTLNWTPDATQFIGLGGGTTPAADPDAPPDLFTAIQQQLGLKLESTKAPAEAFVIDRVAKPSDN